MENNRKQKIFVIIRDLVLLVCIGGICYGIYAEFKNEINAKDAEIARLKTSFSSDVKYLKAQINTVAERDSTGYLLNGKPVEVSTILNSANKWYAEKERLRIELQLCRTELQLSRANEKITSDNEKAYKEGFNKANSAIKRLNQTITDHDPNKYKEYERFYNYANRNYKLSYTKTRDTKDSMMYILSYTGFDRLDTALYYLNQINSKKAALIPIEQSKKNNKNK